MLPGIFKSRIANKAIREKFGHLGILKKILTLNDGGSDLFYSNLYKKWKRYQGTFKFCYCCIYFIVLYLLNEYYM